MITCFYLYKKLKKGVKPLGRKYNKKVHKRVKKVLVGKKPKKKVARRIKKVLG